MESTVRLGLPLLMAGQAQKDVTHNEALHAIDRLVALAVQSRTRAAPPAVPAAGAAYIVPPGTGTWPAAPDTLMVWDGHGWVATAAPAGTVAFIIEEAATCVKTASGWSSGWPAGGLTIGGRAVLAAPPVAVTVPAGGAVIDAEARASIAAIVGALLSQGIVM